MNDWQRVKDVFQQVCDLPLTEREAFLNRVCDFDASLRKEVEELLASDDHARGFLEPSVGRVLGDNGEATDQPGKTWAHLLGREDGVLGPYRAIKLLGKGGMGVVILGERSDDQYRQQVAIKVMRVDQFGEDHERRFRRERQVLATMEHPGIARIFDGGVTDDGRPYFVMEYVRGTHLTRYCREQNLSVEQRLRLFIKVCHAVSYAHQKLVVHRDLKPGNVMVDEHGEPRLLDFGIAKLLETGTMDSDVTKTSLTRDGLVCMTPDYASPEQFRGDQITTASDVYALGVMLFELLTDTRPFNLRTMSPVEMDRIKNTEPLPKPSSVVGTLTRDLNDPVNEAPPWTRPETPARLRRMLRGDLDNIVHMAMRREPHRRYQTADQLAQDVADYLDHKPVRAQPDSLPYRMKKLMRRHRAMFAAAALILICATAGFLATLWQWRRAEYEYRVAAEIADFLTELFRAADPSKSAGEEVSVRHLLDAAAKRIDGELESEPEARSRLMGIIGDAYFGLGDYEKANSIFQKTLELKKEVFGPLHLDLANTMNSKALALRRLGHYLEASDYYQRALSIFRHHADGDSEELVMALNNLASLWDDMGKKKDARQLYEEALAMCQRVHGSDHPAHATLTNNLAFIYEAQGDYAKAEASFAAVLDKVTRLLGERHPYTLASMINLSRVRRLQGRLESARPLAEKALVLSKEVYPAGSADIADARLELAAVETQQGELVNALEACKQAMETYSKVYPENHFRLAGVQITMGKILRLQKSWDEAGDAYREALTILKNGEHRDPVLEARICLGLSECLEALGEREEARHRLVRADDILREARPPDDALRKRVSERLAATGRQLGHPSGDCVTARTPSGDSP